MLQLAPQQRILLSVKPLDFRSGINTLIALCEYQLHQNPSDGTLFIFTNRKRTAVKILTYDGQGFWLCMKRFSQGKLQWWPNPNTATYTLSAQKLQILLYQGDPERANIKPNWRDLPYHPLV